MCETRDLSIKWPQWHTLPPEGQFAVDMRVVCPQDVKDILSKQARMVQSTSMRSWKRSVAGASPSHDAKTEKHLDVVGKLDGRGWRMGAEKTIRHWSDEKKCRRCHCEQHTAPRASFTCYTRNFLRRVHVARDCWILFCSKVVPCFTTHCLTHSCLHAATRLFLHLHSVRLPLFRC